MRPSSFWKACDNLGGLSRSALVDLFRVGRQAPGGHHGVPGDDPPNVKLSYTPLGFKPLAPPRRVTAQAGHDSPRACWHPDVGRVGAQQAGYAQRRTFLARALRLPPVHGRGPGPMPMRTDPRADSSGPVLSVNFTSSSEIHGSRACRGPDLAASKKVIGFVISHMRCIEPLFVAPWYAHCIQDKCAATTRAPG